MSHKVRIEKSIGDMAAFRRGGLDRSPLRTSASPQAEPLAANGQPVGDVNAALAFLSRQGGQAPDEDDVLTSETRAC